MLPYAALPLSYVPHTFCEGQVRGIGHPQMVDWLHRLLTGELLVDAAEVEVYKLLPHQIWAMLRPETLKVPCPRLMLKQFGWPGPQQYVMSFLTRSKAFKEYRTACHLLAHGLHTPLPLGACEVRRRGFIQANAYVMEAITDAITLHTYCSTLPDGPTGMQEILQLAATYVRCMHDSGLWHRDLMLANFLLTGPPGQRRLYLVDLSQARRVPYMPAWLRALDVARIEWCERKPQFLALYASGRYSPRYLLWITQLWNCWRAGRRWVFRLFLNPLQRRLGLK
jgi:hypothetical protein